MKVAFRTNLGSIDAKKLGLDHKKCQSGKSLDVTKDVAEALQKMGVAVPEEDATSDPLIQSARGVPDAEVTGVAEAPAVKGVEEGSPVSNENAAEAIADIGNMRSKEKLQHIIDNDPRVTVKDAAKKRLASL